MATNLVPAAPLLDGLPIDNPEDLHTLLSLARDKSVDGRTALVKALGDLFYDSHSELSVDERNLMGDILQRLIGDVEAVVRKALAETLSGIPDAPPQIISALANDTLEIAYPILIESAVLQDMELVEIIRHRTHEHHLAIAMRSTVSETVSDALVDTDNNDVIRTLVENRGAQISGETLEKIVDRSESQTDLQPPCCGGPNYRRCWRNACIGGFPPRFARTSLTGSISIQSNSTSRLSAP